MLAALIAVAGQGFTPVVIPLSDGLRVPIRSFEVGTSDEPARLRDSRSDLVIVRVKKASTNLESLARSLRYGPNGRRVVLVEFPAMGTNAGNALLWRMDWDMDRDGRLDGDAPTWLRPRNSDGFYPIDSSSHTLRNRLLGAHGLAARVAKAGFDGIVVSSVDDAKRKGGYDARLIVDLATEGRRHRSGFVTLFRNPAPYLDYPAVRSLVDGFVGDGVSFGTGSPVSGIDQDAMAKTVDAMKWAVKQGKLVLSIGYSTDKDQIAEFKRQSSALRFVPAVFPKKSGTDALASDSR
jgi:hypothetical protein